MFGELLFIHRRPRNSLIKDRNKYSRGERYTVPMRRACGKLFAIPVENVGRFVVIYGCNEHLPLYTTSYLCFPRLRFLRSEKQRLAYSTNTSFNYYIVYGVIRTVCFFNGVQIFLSRLSDFRKCWFPAVANSCKRLYDSVAETVICQ